jgi:hypothetical protein
MKILYSQEEFDSAKSTSKLPLKCIRCHSIFLCEKRKIQAVLAGNKCHTREFCSGKCRSEHRSPSIVVECKQCLFSFKKKPAEIKKTKHNFCSQSCAAKWHNAHKTTGTRVSKLERWLQEQLLLLFPNLEFHFNRTDAIEAELDIFIPSLRLAFEINGIFHYEPIYGLKKFSSIQSNDQRKMLACAERGIELCVIDVSSVVYVKPARCQKFIDIISNIVNGRLVVAGGLEPPTSALSERRSDQLNYATK